MTTSDNQAINIECGSCDKRTNQKIVSEYLQAIADEYEFEGEILHDDFLLRMSLCSACETINLSVQDDGGEVSVLYPAAPKEVEGLPADVAKAYKAARAVRMIDANAFAVLLGRVLELVCLDRKAKGQSLSDQLKDLASKGEIPGPLADMSHQLRFLRNVGAHATLGDLTTGEVPILDELCGAILEYVYTAPHRVEKVAKRIDELKKRKRN